VENGIHQRKTKDIWNERSQLLRELVSDEQHLVLAIKIQPGVNSVNIVSIVNFGRQQMVSIEGTSYLSARPRPSDDSFITRKSILSRNMVAPDEGNRSRGHMERGDADLLLAEYYDVVPRREMSSSCVRNRQARAQHRCNGQHNELKHKR
jgi:hypothetical protein